MPVLDGSRGMVGAAQEEMMKLLGMRDPFLVLGACVALAGAMVGCGDDDTATDAGADGGTAGKAGSSGKGGAGGKSGAGGAGTGATAGKGGTGGAGTGGAGKGGTGGKGGSGGKGGAGGDDAGVDAGN